MEWCSGLGDIGVEAEGSSAVDVDFMCVGDGRVVVRVRFFRFVSFRDVLKLYRWILKLFKLGGFRVREAALDSPYFVELVFDVEV